jgi:RNA polymerase sigma factor (sigma-70 family)
MQKTLQAVLRSLSAATPAESDGELLRRYLGGDADAFAELVRRHGRLVWSVCRHLTRSDAEADDAFQAIFVVLLRNAGKIRDPNRLSAWLHGVAYRVCTKARLAARRRSARERVAAASELNGHAVADTAWDRTLAVVHEEAGRLPEALRVPFVLCCLEGKPVTEAAQQLGWKLGTLSGRLTRAKDALLRRLEARGLTLGAIAALGLAAPPTAALARAASLAKVGFVVPVTILQLSQGVIGMSTFSFKVLAAGLLVACGLGVGVGSKWVATADAQTPAQDPQKKTDPNAEIKRLEAELDRARSDAERLKKARESQSADAVFQELFRAANQKALAQGQHADALALFAATAQQRDSKETFTSKTTKWEYDFVEVSDMDQRRFMKFLQDRENRGWEYNGTTTLKDGNLKQEIWVFRRPAGGTAGSSSSRAAFDYYTRRMLSQPAQSNPNDPVLGNFFGEMKRAVPLEAAGNQVNDARAIQAEIARLQAQLANLKSKPNAPRVVIDRKDLPLEPRDLTDVLLKLAGKKFKNANYSITPSDAGIVVEGDKQVIDWVADTIKKLGGK